MIDPSRVALFVPGHLKRFKLLLFNRIGETIEKAGGRVVRSDFAALDQLPDEIIPIVGCTPELRPLIDRWQARKRQWVYWDRGYLKRVFATWLPRGENGGFYRWHCNGFQLQEIRDVPDDRWKALQTPASLWARNGKHIVVAIPTPTYEKFHKIEGWTDRTLRALALLTDRQIVTRDKESKRPLQADLDGAHCLVAHGSNAAVEAVILGCPVVVDRCSAASLVGRTDLKDIENPIYPDREPWLRALSYSQFNERELCDGTLFRLIT